LTVKINQKIHYYLSAAVALTVLLAYLPALRNEFVNWDDDLYVYDNPQIRSLGAAFFRWAFTTTLMGNWNPLTWISHALDYAVWGLNPLGHHLTSIVLHSMNAALVVVLAVKLLEIVVERSALNESVRFLDDRRVLIAAGVTGLLFGIHPVHVESVAWVSERKDLLCALFFLLSLIVYVKYFGGRQSAADGQTSGVRSQESKVKSLQSTRLYLLSLGFFVLALMSKPMAVTLPVVLLILDWYPLGGITSLKTLWAAGVEKLPFFALGLSSAVLTILAQRAEGAMTAMEVVPWPFRTLVATKSLVVYLGKMLLPVQLLPFYPYPKDVSLLSPEYLLAICLVIGVTAGCIILAGRQKLWLAAWGYYVVTLIPVVGIVQAGGQAMADRYTYLPSLGPFLIVGIAAAIVSEKAGKSKQKGLVAASYAAALVVLAVLFSLAIGQIAVWRTSMDLWNDVIKKEPEKAPLAYYNRGQVFMSTGSFDKAIEDYSRAVALNPFYQEAFYNRGLALEKSGQPGRAAEDYERAILLNPSNYQALNNRGVLYGAAGSFEKAIEFFSRALAINPDYPDAHFNRGITYTLAGRRDLALADFNKVIALNERFAPAYLNRGKLLVGMDRKGAAEEDFRKACELGIREACSAIR
jgi:protein O-mannosyl-transferase